jgi:hypothetical protein
MGLLVESESRPRQVEESLPVFSVKPGGKTSTWIYGDTSAVHRRFFALTILAAWLGVVSFLAWTHLVWRDEVRALSLAVQGDNVFAMLKGLHGEGHPALWYLLLRAAHNLVARPEVLLLVSLAAAAVALSILVLRSPFSLPFPALILLTRFSIYEYSVMARNYGLSMIFVFLFAVFYKRRRDRDCTLGVLLFLLANCSVPSALLVGGLLLFWFMDIVYGVPADRSRHIRMFLWNTAIAGCGLLISFLTISPTFNDSAPLDPHRINAGMLITAVLFPSLEFMPLSHLPLVDRLAAGMPLGPLMPILKSWILWGSTLGLIRRRSAFIAALATLAGFSLYFAAVYPGWYRHQALWIVFMIGMYWLAAPEHTQTKPASVDWLPAVGTLLFVLVVLQQVPYGVRRIVGAATDPIAAIHARSDNLGSILAAHPDLKESVIIANPDFLLETLPYYVSNPTYLLHEQRYGNVDHFTRKAKLKLSLGEVLNSAVRLRKETGRPVVILLWQKIDPSQPAQTYREAYNWEFTVTPEQAREFQQATRFLQHHNAPPGTSEGYDVYVLDR